MPENDANEIARIAKTTYTKLHFAAGHVVLGFWLGNPYLDALIDALAREVWGDDWIQVKASIAKARLRL